MCPPPMSPLFCGGKGWVDGDSICVKEDAKGPSGLSSYGALELRISSELSPETSSNGWSLGPG